MGRFHRHDDGTSHEHGDGHGHAHDHQHDDHQGQHLGDHSGYQTGSERIAVLERIFGENARVMVYAITEGEEKPLKYPVMFRSSQLVLINKVDLLPHLDFDLAAFRANLRAVNPGVDTVEISARTGEGVDAWCDWLRAGRAAFVSKPAT
jgi:hypothetical protein